MKEKRRIGRKLLGFMLALALVISAFTGMIPGTVMVVLADEVWQEISSNAIQSGDTIIITSTTSDGETYGMANDGGLSAPQAVGLTITDGTLTVSEADLARCVWTVERDGNSFIFKSGSEWLYCIGANNGVRVGSNDNNQFEIKNDYLYHTNEARYLGVLNKSDWRCYSSIHNNIKGQTLQFWKKGASGGDTVSVTGVTLNESSATLTVGGSKMLTATISPENATDKTVKWSVGGTDANAVKLYTDADCTAEVGTDATDVLTVYAKGISAGSATVTATSNADSTKSASCNVTVSAAASEPEIAPVSYKAATVDGTTHAVTFTDETCADYTVVTDSAEAVTWSAGWYVVNSTVEISGLITCAGDVHLILCDGASLTASPGITGDNNNPGSFTVYAQSTDGDMGEMNVTGTSGFYSKQNITINGGKVDAAATGSNNTGIGAGNNVIINGGYVNATGSYSGLYTYSENVTINGGTVTTSGSRGIVAGYWAGDVIINGGTVIISGSKGSIGGRNVTIATDLSVKAGADESSAAAVTDYATNFGNYKWAKIETAPEPADGGYYAAYDVTTDTNKTKSGDALTALQVTFNERQWYIIEDNSSSATSGTVTLLSADTSFGTKTFDNENKNNKYSTSQVKAYLDSMTGTNGAFADVAEAIETVNLTTNKYDSTEEYETVNNVKLYLLSTEEAKSLPANVRKAEFTGGDCSHNEWWLRSPGHDDGYAAFVYGDDGGVNDDAYDVLNYALGVRPALKLKLESVIFSSESQTFTVGSAASEPENIIISPASGDIAEALAAAEEGKTVGDITINLTEGVTYTISNTIVAPASLTINGNGAIIDAGNLNAPMIALANIENPTQWTELNIAVSGLYVNGLKKQMFYSACENYLCKTFTVDNCVVEVAADVITFDFTKGSVAESFVISNSTFYAPTATTKSLYSSQGGQKLTEYDKYNNGDTQSFKLTHNTFFNLAPTKNFFVHRQNSQNWLSYEAKGNVFANCGKSGKVIIGLNGGASSAKPTWDIDGNLFNYDGADTSATETTGDNNEPVKNSVAGVVTFVAPASGNFNGTLELSGGVTLPEKLGDPRFTLSSHTHSFTYSASGATITATCSADGCTLPVVEGKPTATLTIAASGGTYDGTTAYGATIIDDNSIQGDAKVQYQKKTGESYGTATETAPTDAGDYKASITVGGATASVEYTIAQADSTANAPTGLTATYGQTLANVSLEGKNPEGNTPGTWAWANSTQSVGNVVTPAATFKATFTPDSSNYKTVENVDVTVTVGKADPTAPTGLTATYGQTLANVTLPDGWTWADNTQSVGNVVDPAATFKANFAGDDNHNSASNVDVTVTVGKANAVAATVTANSRTYDGTEKPLVTVTGTPTGGTMYYALGTNATTAPADNLYTTSIPIATDPGTYYVWYKVKGDGNHSDSEAAYVAVSIVRDHGDVTDEDMPAGGIIPDGIWIAGIRDLKYTGKALKQDYRLYDGNKLLLEKTDYTASYKNNTKAYEAGEIIDPNKAPTLNIRMKGNYREVEPVYFNITRVDIGEDEFRVSDMSTAYTGNKQTPAPVLTWSGKKLRPGTDFTVKEYVENTYDFVGKADETTVYDLTVKGIGNFTGERKITLTIAGKTEKAGEEKTVPVVLMKDVKTPSIPEQAYTGEEYDLDSLRDNKGNKLAFTVIYKNKNTVLVPGTDYEAEFTDAREAGTATLILRGLGANDSETGFCFVGEKRITFKIKGLQITGAKVNGLEKSYQYTGEAIEPVITLEKDGKAIPEADYTVEYINNVKAGTASVMITGHNSCQGTKKADFKITPYDLSTDKGAIVINGGEAITTEYVKGGAQPGVTVTFRGGKLIEGRDYTVKYSNNKQVAKADAGKKAPTVTVTGKGMLKGSKAVPFTIGLRRFVEGNGLTVLASDITAGSKAGTSKIKVLDSDGKELKAGQDYKKEVKYYNAETEDEINKDTKLTEVGTVVKVEITGMGTYTDDKLTGVFRIIAKDNNISKATIRIANQEYTGKEVKITDQKQFVNATIKIGGVTKQLTLGKDFEIVEGTYVRNVKKGTAKVTIHGLKGGEEGLNLGGYKTVTFRIKERSIKEWWEGLLDFFG